MRVLRFEHVYLLPVLWSYSAQGVPKSQLPENMKVMDFNPLIGCTDSKQWCLISLTPNFHLTWIGML